MNFLKVLIPQELPKTEKDFDAFCKNILALAKTKDSTSYRHAIATMVMHLSPTTNKKAPMFFIKSIKKAITNEIAYKKIKDYNKEMYEYPVVSDTKINNKDAASSEQTTTDENKEANPQIEPLQQ